MNFITAPDRIHLDTPPKAGPKVFLAGSIENGAAPEWQQSFRDSPLFITEPGFFLNPRRRWITKPSYELLQEQVFWEQDYLAAADLVVFVFLANTASPITLLEFGQCIERKVPMVVYCEEDYWRRGNVELMLDRQWRLGVSIHQSVSSLPQLRNYVFGWINSWNKQNQHRTVLT